MLRAFDLVEENERAVVLFTRGRAFELEPNGVGSTGHWIIAERRSDELDRVIIYHRRDDMNANDVYIASFDGLSPSPPHPDDPNRWRKSVIHFSGWRHVSETEADWEAFGGTKQNGRFYL